MAHRPPSSSNPEAEVALEFDDTQALRALTAEGTLPPLLILSKDAHLIDAARKAAPTGMAITDAADVDEIADRMPAMDPGVLIVDTAGSRDVAAILPQLAQHFPEMVVIVVGNKEDSGTLLRLTAEGRVFRFLLHPLSHGQARLAIKAAIAQHLDLKASGARRSMQSPPQKPRSYTTAYVALAVAALLAIGGVWFVVDRLTVEPAPATASDPVTTQPEPRVLPERVDPVSAELQLAREALEAGNVIAPRGESALDFYRNALALDPTNEEARAGVRQVADKILERAEAALTAERLEEATRNIEIARDIDPSHSRLVFLDVQVARERERLRLTQERGVDERVRKLLAQADAYMRAGRLLAPQSGNARSVLLNARRLDPTDPAVARGMRDLTLRLAEEARKALDAGELTQAESLVAAARELGSEGAVLATIERQLAQAQRAARAPSPEPPPAAEPASSTQVASARVPAPAPLTQTGSTRVQPPAQETTAPAAPPTASAIEERIDAVRLPRTRETPAKYPRDALLARTEGYVDLEFTISPEGVPEDVVVRASEPRRIFDRAAVDAVRRWRFQPVVRDGVAVAQPAKLRMTFQP